jgi:hypothetical protein
MITEETATQIARRSQWLGRINGCLENAERIKYAELAVEYCDPADKRIAQAFPLSITGVLKWLREMKAYEEVRLDELNTLAVQEAQNVN